MPRCTDKFLDAFGDNDQPWDRWSPPVFDDDEFLTYQRSLGVKPQKYSREIVFRMQDRKTPGNSVRGWIVQEDGKPFPVEAQYSHYLGKKAIETIEGLVANGSLQHHPLYTQLDIFVDPRWAGYWAEFRMARYDDLPMATGDMQLFTAPA